MAPPGASAPGGANGFPSVPPADPGEAARSRRAFGQLRDFAETVPSLLGPGAVR